jgi:predicted alpha/beta hydrolase family esterase
LPYRPADPLSVNTPLAQAGVQDRRAAFAVLVERELLASGANAATDAWLHGPRPDAGAHAALVERLDRQFAVRRASTVVLIVPGLFGDCVADQSVPFGDGKVRPPDEQPTAAYEQYADLRLRRILMLQLPGRATSARNGERLAAAIREEAAQPGVERIVLVAYSKGVPDALHALDAMERSGGVPPQVKALVSVGGAVMGTPLADRFEGVYDAISPRVAPFGCSAAEGDELASITRRERLRWMSDHPLPSALAYYTILAYASAEETAPLLHASYALLSRVDPRNDGQLIAGDSVLPGSTLLAAARADHWDVALPRDRHPSAWVHGLASGRHYPREALFRATIRWVVGSLR